MKRLVVGVDGSPGSVNALLWAADLATRHEAEIVAMTGFVPTESELPPERVETLFAEQQVLLESWTESVRANGLRLRTVVERGDPRPGILALARQEQADVVVVGRVGQSAGPGILHIGSMAEWLAHHADLPVAVIGGAVNVTTRSVLVGVDGSEGSKAAVRWVGDLVAGSEIWVLAASVAQPYLEWTPADSPKNWRRALEQQIRDEYAADLTTADVEFRALALRGSNVSDALLEVAKEERADVIVVGSRGLGGFSGLRVGGVALKTLHRTDRPVVLVPAEDQ